MQLIYYTPTPNMKKSKEYFSKLDFDLHQIGETCYAYDQQLCLCITSDKKQRPGLCFVKKSWSKELDDLRIFAKVHSVDGVHYLASPSGTWIQLREEEEFKLPLSQKKSLLGNFAGLSVETLDIELSARIFACLGFEHSMGDLDKGWMTYTDRHDNNISLMAPFSCPHLFLNPSLTFFNGAENHRIIQALRDLSIPILEEVTAFNKNGMVDNIILSEPGGYGFFVFND